MQDTFFVDVERLLRTHTTAIQTRVLEEQKDQLPIRSNLSWKNLSS